jgi:hypothetical protein
VSLSHRRLAWAESVMGHIQHLILESLVKMDHFQKEPLNFKRDHRGTGGQGGRHPGMSDLVVEQPRQGPLFGPRLPRLPLF